MRGRVAEPFTERISMEPTSGCWLWSGAVNEHGYGYLVFNGRPQRAHRVALQLAGKSIPEGKFVDHLCRVRCCVNPDHLEVVDHRENTLRGLGITAANARKTHCKRGHALSGDNLRSGSHARRRSCYSCHLELQRIRYAKKKGAA